MHVHVQAYGLVRAGAPQWIFVMDSSFRGGEVAPPPHPHLNASNLNAASFEPLVELYSR